VKTSAIGWTDFSSGDLNFVTGCTKAGPGCANCYGEAIYKRFGRDFSVVKIHEDKLDRLYRKRFPEFSPKRGAPHKPMCFVCDTGDLFHERVPDSFIFDAFDMMDILENVTWQVLTKRPERAAAMHLNWTENIWMGISASTQETFDQRWYYAGQIEAAVRFVSLEPMLSPVDLTDVRIDRYTRMNILEGCGIYTGPGVMGQSLPNCYGSKLSWVVLGAESGPKRRPFDVAWAESVRQQCIGADVAYFGKQDSASYPGKPLLFSGEEHKEWPSRWRVKR